MNLNIQQLLARARANVTEKQQLDIEKHQSLHSSITKVEEEDVDQSGLEDDQIVEILEDHISVSSAGTINSSAINNISHIPGVARTDITYNDKQERAISMAERGEDFVLIGAAGTGKTTTVRGMTRKLIDSGRIGKLNYGTKWLRADNPGIIVTSFTRKAVNNIRYAVVPELRPNVHTMHKFLEFAPQFYEVEDPKDPSKYKTTMKFEPQRTRLNPLPEDIKMVIYEEGSMISTELYLMMEDALPHPHQEVFIGDIQQLPPVFGWAILGFKMTLLPIVELTEVYRQAMNSPIISLAHKILDGNPIPFKTTPVIQKMKHPVTGKEMERKTFPELELMNISNEYGTVHFHPWQKKLGDLDAIIAVNKQFEHWIDNGFYNPEEDMILCPFNKAFGTIELNLSIMNYLGKKRNATVYEIIAGFNKFYYAVGDRVLYDKEDAVIIDININGAYMGKDPAIASKSMNRRGAYEDVLDKSEIEASIHIKEQQEDYMEKMLTEIDISEPTERVNQASHVITIQFTNSEDSTELRSSGEINALLGGYAITVHKAQGSEYEKVFLLFHHSHSRGTLCNREMLYTAVTRAKNFLYIVCEPDTFEKGIKSQRIRGNSLEDKIKVFMGVGELAEFDAVMRKVKNTSNPLGPISNASASGTETTLSVISGKKAVKLIDLVSQQMQEKAQRNLDSFWTKSLGVFNGKDIGVKPTLSFNLNRRRTLGLASFTKNTIYLNPVWTAAGEHDAEINQEMLYTTLWHELMHIVAYKAYGDNKHGAFWKLCMIKVGQKPDVTYKEGKLPPWMMAKEQLLDKIFKGTDVMEQLELSDPVDSVILDSEEETE